MRSKSNASLRAQEWCQKRPMPETMDAVARVSSRVCAPILVAKLCARNSGWFGPKRSNGQTRPAIPETTMYPAAIRRVESEEGCNWLGTISRDAHFIQV